MRKKIWCVNWVTKKIVTCPKKQLNLTFCLKKKFCLGKKMSNKDYGIQTEISGFTWIPAVALRKETGSSSYYYPNSLEPSSIL